MLRALTMLLGTGLLVVPALAVPAVLRIRGRAPFALAALVIAAATLVITFEALSIVGELQRGWILLVQAAIAAGSAAAWLAAGRPRPALPAPPKASEIAAIARRHPGAAVAVGIAGIAFAINLLVALTVAPNNFDSMTYHLSRVGYWLQYDHIGWFPNGSERQLANPPNAEVLQGWPIALMESDRLSPLVQLVAAAGTAGAVFMGARMLRFGAAGAAFAAALFSLLPMNVLQATSTQNDMVLAFLVGRGGRVRREGPARPRDRGSGDRLPGSRARVGHQGHAGRRRARAGRPVRRHRPRVPNPATHDRRRIGADGRSGGGARQLPVRGEQASDGNLARRAV